MWGVPPGCVALGVYVGWGLPKSLSSWACWCGFCPDGLSTAAGGTSFWFVRVGQLSFCSQINKAATVLRTLSQNPCRAGLAANVLHPCGSYPPPGALGSRQQQVDHAHCSGGWILSFCSLRRPYRKYGMSKEAWTVGCEGTR